MKKPLNPNQEWLTLDQSAVYLGVSKRSITNVVNIKLKGLGNESLKIKKFGNRTLISKTSLDNTEKIYTNEKKIPPIMGRNIF